MPTWSLWRQAESEHMDAAGECGTSNSDSFTLSNQKLWHSGIETSNSLHATILLNTQSMPAFSQYAAAPSNNSDNLTDLRSHASLNSYSYHSDLHILYRVVTTLLCMALHRPSDHTVSRPLAP